jgi:hypothetical protein
MKGIIKTKQTGVRFNVATSITLHNSFVRCRKIIVRLFDSLVSFVQNTNGSKKINSSYNARYKSNYIGSFAPFIFLLSYIHSFLFMVGTFICLAFGLFYLVAGLVTRLWNIYTTDYPIIYMIMGVFLITISIYGLSLFF